MPLEPEHMTEGMVMKRVAERDSLSNRHGRHTRTRGRHKIRAPRFLGNRSPESCQVKHVNGWETHFFLIGWKPEASSRSHFNITMASSMPMIRLESLLGQDKIGREDSRRMRSSSHSMSSCTSSKSIPIHLNHDDIQEEWEIREQEWIAEERDSIMFQRIVNGMIARQGSALSNASSSYQSETDKSIANIMRTRYKSMELKSSKVSDVCGVDAEEETEFAYNGSNPNHSNTASNAGADNRPPDTIFVMDM